MLQLAIRDRHDLRMRQPRIVVPGISRLGHCSARMQRAIRWWLVIWRLRRIWLAEVGWIHATELQVLLDCRYHLANCMLGRWAVALPFVPRGQMISIELGKLQVKIHG